MLKKKINYLFISYLKYKVIYKTFYIKPLTTDILIWKHIFIKFYKNINYFINIFQFFLQKYKYL